MLFFLTLPVIALGNWGLDNGVGRTPQMGWNSWNHYHCNLNQDVVTTTIKLMVSTGLSAAGYVYVNLDDCWAGSRMANGTIIPDQKTFPNGIAPLAELAHQNNLLFGLYSDAGNKTCAGRPGSLGYEQTDADTYAFWKVDYLKYDNCNNDNIPPQTRYPLMRDALNSTGRHIFFSMCEWGADQPWNWAQPVGNSWRTTGDIGDNWKSMLSNWDNNGPASAAGPGGWNDPDMLEVGNGGMSTTEYITHFSLWCIGKAPLLIGCDVSNMTDDTKMILMNKEAIAVNQDPLGIQASSVYQSSDGNQDIYAASLINNEIAVVMLNRDTSQHSITVTWQEMGVDTNTKYIVRDLWKHENVTTTSGSYTDTVQPHGAVFLPLQLLESSLHILHTMNIVFFIVLAASSLVNAYDYYTIYVDTCGEPLLDPRTQSFVYDTNSKLIRAAAYNNSYCVFAQGNSNPCAVTRCDSNNATQQWTYNLNGQFVSTQNSCLDVFNFAGPNVEEWGCKTSGDMSNQQWTINKGQSKITNININTNYTKCLTILKPQ